MVLKSQLLVNVKLMVELQLIKYSYTGAPFFSANASALLGMYMWCFKSDSANRIPIGADMSHVICEPQAAQVTHPAIRKLPYKINGF